VTSGESSSSAGENLVLFHNYTRMVRVWILRVFGQQICSHLLLTHWEGTENQCQRAQVVPESPGKSYGGAREPRKELWPEDHRVICFPLTVLFLSGGGGPRTMAAAHDLEIEEDVNLNMETEMKEELEEEKMREGRADKDPFKPRKVHRIVSKWMLPESVRRTYLERANCLPPPLFIIFISIAEVNVPGGAHWRKDSWGAAGTLGLQITPGGKTGKHVKRAWGWQYSTHRTRLRPLQSPLPRFLLPSQALSVTC